MRVSRVVSLASSLPLNFCYCECSVHIVAQMHVLWIKIRVAGLYAKVPDVKPSSVFSEESFGDR